MGDLTERDLKEILARNDQVQILDGGRATAVPAKTAVASAGIRTMKQEAPWTETERAFALEYLQPALEKREYLWYMAQVTVFMFGQTYTFDFVALRPEGGADHFEVKGKKKLGSQDRSSVKVRWATAFLQGLSDSPHRVFWAKRGEGEWHVREVILRRQRHPICGDCL
ncbi:MAG: hypothetical protein KC441_05400 [Anaerolineales bacterium]|nr:hypothetical protein [Anaerolineales bacterium]MCA9885518.1 hypothetical protein [Anaerolineae bacterium]